MKLSGSCPMGCGETLASGQRLARHGAGWEYRIECVNPTCPRPAAVSELLRLRDVIEHRVSLEPDRFQVVHPLRERFGDLIARCPLDEYLKSLDGPPATPGVYLAEQDDAEAWTFTPWSVAG